MISTVVSYHKAKARRPTPGAMNKTEQAYAQHLELRKRAGEIVDYWFEAVNFKLGKNCHYRPDFMVVTKGLDVEFHEVKGFKRKPNGEPGYYAMDDGKAKVKMAADKFPFRFVVVFQAPKKDGGIWHEEDMA